MRARLRILGLALGLLAGPPSAALRADTAPVIADVQVRQVGPAQWVVLVRATAEQAFDVRPAAPGRVTVRLYRVAIGATAAPAATEFGGLGLVAEPGGHALLRIELADPTYRVRVAQGSGPGQVEVRVGR
jgi:hypothetical protein